MDFHCLLMCVVWQLKESLLALHAEGMCVALQCQVLYHSITWLDAVCASAMRGASPALLFTATSLGWAGCSGGQGCLCITGVKSCPLSALRHKPAFTLWSRAEELGSDSSRYPWVSARWGWRVGIGNPVCFSRWVGEVWMGKSWER